MIQAETLGDDGIPARAGLTRDLLLGIVYFYITSIPVLVGVLFGVQFVEQRGPSRLDPIDACIRQDGAHYLDIAKNGYRYDSTRRSTVAFFPAYPLLARALAALTAWPLEIVLLLISNLFLTVSFVLFAMYLRMRDHGAQPGEFGWTLLVFGLFPGSLFLRMAYAESLFVASMLAALIGMARRWPLVLIAFTAGLATSVRPVGVAVSAAVIWYTIRLPDLSVSRRTVHALLIGPLSCWGLFAYMAYQQVTFDMPLAFAQTQEHWTVKLSPEDRSANTKFWSLATLEPIRGMYDPSSIRYWAGSGLETDALFELDFWNPILFLGTAGLIVYGAWRRLLTGPEIIMNAALLLIPYVTRAYEMSMSSHARFAVVVIGAPIVGGHLLARIPPALAAGAMCLSAVFLCLWSALYVTGYRYF